MSLSLSTPPSVHPHHSKTYIHLIYLSHGNHGSKDDWTNVKALLERQYRTMVHDENKESASSSNHNTWNLLISNSNGEDTHVGVLKGGENAAEELLAYVRTHWAGEYEIEPRDIEGATPDDVYLEETTKSEIQNNEDLSHCSRGMPRHTLIHSNIVIELYWIGHSLGGLFSRAGIGFLAESAEWQCGIIRPRSYISLCSPHLGSRRPGGTLLKNLWRFGANFYSLTLGQTGRDLFLKNNVLMRLSEEDYFTRPLRQFESRTLCSVCHHDVAVPYAASAIRSHNPYEPPVMSKNIQHGFHLKGYSGFYLERHMRLFESVFPNVEQFSVEEMITEFKPHSYQSHEAHLIDGYFKDSQLEVEFSKKMLHNLNGIGWRRIDMQFHLRNRLDRLKMHEVPLAKHKVPYLRTPTMLSAGEYFVTELLFPMLWYDRIHSTEFMRGAWKEDSLGLSDVVVVCGGEAQPQVIEEEEIEKPPHSAPKIPHGARDVADVSGVHANTEDKTEGQ
mmetsp:Transcript_2734/g.10503  ORF Transcript_2734/g.10503 Transcript_2734/m.10503 type:complete len:502 (-) Transcript_2734:521-2026(-)